MLKNANLASRTKVFYDTPYRGDHPHSFSNQSSFESLSSNLTVSRVFSFIFLALRKDKIHLIIIGLTLRRFPPRCRHSRRRQKTYQATQNACRERSGAEYYTLQRSSLVSVEARQGNVAVCQGLKMLPPDIFAHSRCKTHTFRN